MPISGDDLAAGGGVGVGPDALQRGPVAVGQLDGPLLDLFLPDRGPDVFVGVGGLLNGGVVSDLCVGVIRPCDHHLIGQQAVLMGLAAQRAVDDGAGLGPGNEIIGAEHAVIVALDQAKLHGGGQIAGVPLIAGDVGEAAVIDVALKIGVLEEAHGDLGQLGTGDRRGGAEGSVGITAQNAHLGQGGNGVAAPHVGGHVGVGVDLAPVLLPGRIPEHAEEDRGHLSPGNICFRSYRAVGEADDVGIVVLRVEIRRGIRDHGIRNDDDVLMVVEAHKGDPIGGHAALGVDGAHRVVAAVQFGHGVGRAGGKTTDAWASTFGETVTAIELSPEGYTLVGR